MGNKWCSTSVMDGFFAPLYVGASRIIVMTSSDALPTITGASSGQTGCLVQSSVGSFPTTGYFTIGSSGNNRYCTISACSCDTVLNSGVASYIVICDPTSTIMRYVTTCTTQDLVAGNKVNIGTWTITINQPS